MKENSNSNNEKNIKVLLIPSYMTDDELKGQGIKKDATVEAEYGNRAIEGDVITLAHHIEKYKNNPAPCNAQNVPVLADGSTILVSHIDLDTLGGIAALMGRKKDDPKFWETAEFIDLNGPHNLYKVDENEKDKYNAYQAYSSKNRLPRFTQITDVTDVVKRSLDVLDRVLDGDKELIEEGKIWDKELKEKIESCVVFENDNIRVFDSKDGVFCASSYYSEKQGKVIPSTITYNEVTKNIVLAFEDGGKKLKANKILQELHGNEAGGHDGIAGGPRGQEIKKEDLVNDAIYVNREFIKLKEKEGKTVNNEDINEEINEEDIVI